MARARVHGQGLHIFSARTRRVPSLPLSRVGRQLRFAWTRLMVYVGPGGGGD